jgi:hypothetical protein
LENHAPIVPLPKLLRRAADRPAMAPYRPETQSYFRRSNASSKRRAAIEPVIGYPRTMTVWAATTLRIPVAMRSTPTSAIFRRLTQSLLLQILITRSFTAPLKSA